MIFFYGFIAGAFAWSSSLDETIGTSFVYSYIGILGVIFIVATMYIESKGIFTSFIQLITLYQFAKWIYFVRINSDISQSLFLQKIFRVTKPFAIFSTYSNNFVEDGLEEIFLALTISLVLAFIIYLKKSTRSMLHVLSLISLLTVQDFLCYAFFNLKHISPSTGLDISGIVLSIFYLLCILGYLTYFIIAYKKKKNSILLGIFYEDFCQQNLYYPLLYLNSLLLSMCICLLNAIPVAVYTLSMCLDLEISNNYAGIYTLIFRYQPLKKIIFTLLHHFFKIIIAMLFLLCGLGALSYNTGDNLFLFVLCLALLFGFLRGYVKENVTQVDEVNRKKYEIDNTKDRIIPEHLENNNTLEKIPGVYRMRSAEGNYIESDEDGAVPFHGLSSRNTPSNHANMIYRNREFFNINDITVRAFK